MPCRKLAGKSLATESQQSTKRTGTRHRAFGLKSAVSRANLNLVEVSIWRISGECAEERSRRLVVGQRFMGQPWRRATHHFRSTGFNFAMTFDLATLAPSLERRDPGIWFARRQERVSYPDQGNAACLAVEDRSFWFRHRNGCIVSLVRRFPPEGVFLDIGGGNGFVSRGLTAAGVTCALVEPGSMARSPLTHAV
jgi:hypothetical protein